MSSELHFGRFAVRLQQRQVLRDGQPVELGARAYDVLIMLLQQRGRMVTRQELVEAAWPGVVVEDNNLSVQIWALRKLLGPAAIATVAGRGYQFTEAVAEGPAATPAPANEPVMPAAAPADAPVVTKSARPPTPPIVGREREIVELDASTARLVTLCGMGGAGKTALALQHADRWEARGGTVLWTSVDVHLKSVDVACQLAGLLGMREPAGVKLSAVAKALQGQPVLLVIDGAERSVAAVRELVDELLQCVPALRVLVTSQAPLRSPSETVLRLGGLHLPPEGARAADCLAADAVRFFAAQVRAGGAEMPADDHTIAWATAICRDLDGCPLAIKLAAARVPLLGVQGVGERLAQRFKLLACSGREAELRHQTLQATFDWSYSLLTEGERAVFRYLCDCSGGFTLELATALCRDFMPSEWDTLAALVSLLERSFIAVEQESPRRFRLLESARAYAAMKAHELGEAQAIHRAHACAMRAVAAEAGAAFWTLPEADWMARYIADIENVNVALDWATEHDHTLACELLANSNGMFHTLQRLGEFLRRCDALDSDQAEPLPGPLQARYLVARARVAMISHRAAFDMALEGVQAAHEAGEAMVEYLGLCIAAATNRVPGDLRWSPELVRSAFDRAVRMEDPAWPPRIRRMRHMAWGKLLCDEGRFEEAGVECQAALDLSLAAGVPSLVHSDMANLVLVCKEAGDLRRAIELGREQRRQLAGRMSVARIYVLAELASSLLLASELDEARSCLAEYFEVAMRSESHSIGEYGCEFARLAAAQDRPKAAAMLLGYADAHMCDPVPKPTQAWRAQAHERLAQELGPAVLSYLLREGAALGRETVAALTLSSTEAESSRHEAFSTQSDWMPM